MKLMLMILDGWGLNDNKEESAIERAATPNMDRFIKEYPSVVLDCFGEAVGLPAGQMGNSEVGHLNIGAGRIIYQELTRISKEIKEGSFFNNPELLAAVENCIQNNSALHLMGLFSDGGVHSSLEHLYGLLELAERNGISEVYIHAFLDGRDVPPRSAKKYFEEFTKKAEKIGVGRIATITGRYYAMDRDNRWDRVQQAYEMLTELKGIEAEDPLQAMEMAYERTEDDEFVKPTILKGAAKVADKDSVIFYNFRPDRARELTKAFTEKDFQGFQRNVMPQVKYICMTQYADYIDAPVAFKPQQINNCLAKILSDQGLKQLHIAETEKYAHVTFFFNGGQEDPFPGEDRILIPSPDVTTYDLKPEMSAFEVTEKVIAAIREDKYDIVILNFANADMVGHTGFMDAAVKACEAVDQCVGEIVAEVQSKNGEVLITADHGNSDQMIDPETGGTATAHSLNPVPFVYITDKKEIKLKNGILSDITPTMLDILGIEKPGEVEQDSLIERK